jgi:hypothetical protein
MPRVPSSLSRLPSRDSVRRQRVRLGAHPRETLRDNVLPRSLLEHPTAVLPYVVMRDNVMQRLYAQRTGYWQSDGAGAEFFSSDESATAVDLLAGAVSPRFQQRGHLARS